MKRSIFCVILTFICVHGALSQKLHFESFTVKDGLPQSTVKSIVQDKYGFMWFGTWNGLCRYDGYRFKIYRNIPGDKTSLGNSRIHYIYKDKKGTLWVSTFKNFVCRYNYAQDNFTRFHSNDLPTELRDSTDRLKSFKMLQSSADFLRRYIGRYELSQTKEHFVFEKNLQKDGGLNDINVNCIYIDDSKTLWVGTTTGGVNKADLNTASFKRINLSQKDGTLTNSPIRAITTAGNEVWLGAQDNGVIYLNTSKRIQQHLIKQLSGKSVRSVFKDSRGNVWVGHRNGLDRIEIQSGKTIHLNHALNPDTTGVRFFAIAEDPADNTVWFATSSGLLRFNYEDNTFKWVPLGNLYKASAAGSLMFDSQHSLWLGAENTGLIYLKRNPKTLQVVDIGVFNVESKNKSIPDDRIYGITEDENGNIWVGTANGLCKINPDRTNVQNIDAIRKFSDPYIASLIADKHGSVWIAHKSRLTRLSIASNTIRNYAVTGNSEVYEFADGAGWIDPKSNRVYFGGLDGFIAFDPAKVVGNTYLPRIALTELQVLNRPVAVGQKVNGHVILTKSINLTDSVRLQYDDRSFSIEFAALHYTDPNKNQYAYMLEGADKEWINTNADRRVATYSNLSPGSYLLRIKCANSNGVWNNAERHLKVLVLPPWWMTWWANMLYLLGVLGAAVLIYKIVATRHRYNRNLLTEKLKAEKAAELEQVKSEYFTHISHELRTPLTLIVDPLEALIKGRIAPGLINEHYHVMFRNARRLLDLTNQFLDLRKIQSGKKTLNPEHRDVVGFVKGVKEAFEAKALSKDVDFALITSQEAEFFCFDADVLEKILYNLISNAFKYIKEGGSVKIGLQVNALPRKELLLFVKDNGPGIPAELVERIFEPYYQILDSAHTGIQGTGIGLSLTKELVNLHNGTINVKSVADVETCFTIVIPEAMPVTGSPLNSELFITENAGVLDDTLSPPDISELNDHNLILIVEDNADVRNYLKMCLGNEYRVRLSADGIEGLAMAEELIPDLIISDIMMPGMDGLTLCRTLKTTEKTSHIPVILLTARQSEHFQIEGYETGADAYIGKPFSSALLITRVRGLIESRMRLRKIFNAAQPLDTSVVGFNAADKAFLGKVTEIIQLNFTNEAFDVEWLASQMFMGRTQLYRKIKALTDRTAQEFITTIRMNRAAELLLESDNTISEIAFMVGYADPTSFSRSFQRHYQMTPKKYAQQNKAH